MNKQKLIIEQIDQKLLKFSDLDNMIIPQNGWIQSIRTALKMNLRQLGKLMNITAQSIKEIEARERNGTVSIKVLKQVGEVLGMKFIYGFIPKQKTIEKMIEEKAFQLAKEIVMRTSANMRLEDQENSQERIHAAIRDKAFELKQEVPKYLWD